MNDPIIARAASALLKPVSKVGAVLHAANNIRGRNISTDMRIYRHGQRLQPNKSSVAGGVIQWIECRA